MKTISITGNESSGKTALSYFVGHSLAEMGNKVLIVHTDNEKPTAGLLLNLDEKDKTKSLGKILSSTAVTSQLVVDNLIFTENDNLALLSYAITENRFSYVSPSKTTMEQFFESVSLMVDYLIIDTDNTKKPFDIFCIEKSEAEIFMCTANFKGLTYNISSHETDTPRIQILSKTSPLCPEYDIAGHSVFNGKEPLIVPYCKGLQTLYNVGNITDVVLSKIYIAFISTLAKLLEEVD